MSSGDLKVGDICIIVPPAVNNIGAECEIVGPEQQHEVRVLNAELFEVWIWCFGFKVRITGTGKHFAVDRRCLRKKDPPKEDDATPRDDFVPAQPEFIEDLQRRLTKKPEIA
jgi:hypothetical protein